MALKSCKKWIRDQNKGYEKKIEAYEKKVYQLTDYKTKKQAEERTEKYKRKKELKQAKKANVKDARNNFNLKPTTAIKDEHVDKIVFEENKH